MTTASLFARWPLYGYDPIARTLDCQLCGACCAAPWDKPYYVGLTAAEERGFQRRGLGSYVSADAHSLRTKRASASALVCACLKGNPGGKVGCMVYSVRPRACRIFEPGSEDCLEARRETFGEVPPCR